MSALALHTPTPFSITLEPLAFFFRREKLFVAAGLAIVALILPTLIAYGLDDRTLQDVNVWQKPLKFEGALGVYLFTLALFAGWLPRGTTEKRWYRIYAAIVILAIALEMSWLIGAAALGEASHFNKTMPALIAIYPVMGLLAIILTSATAVYGWLILRDRTSRLDPAFRLSLGLGLILTFFLTVTVAGIMSSSDGHLVGGNLSDVEAAPVMGWARDGGDLRVAHFFATHAMHFIPMFGYLASVALPAPRAGRLAVIAFSAAFTVFVAYTLIQAIGGRPFLLWLG